MSSNSRRNSVNKFTNRPPFYLKKDEHSIEILKTPPLEKSSVPISCFNPEAKAKKVIDKIVDSFKNATPKRTKITIGKVIPDNVLMKSLLENLLEDNGHCKKKPVCNKGTSTSDLSKFLTNRKSGGQRVQRPISSSFETNRQLVLDKFSPKITKHFYDDIPTKDTDVQVMYLNKSYTPKQQGCNKKTQASYSKETNKNLVQLRVEKYNELLKKSNQHSSYQSIMASMKERVPRIGRGCGSRDEGFDQEWSVNDAGDSNVVFPKETRLAMELVGGKRKPGVAPPCPRNLLCERGLHDGLCSW